MTETPSSRIEVSAKPPFYRDVTIVKWLVQLAVLAAVIFVAWFLANEAGDNIRARGLTSGFEFLSQPAGFQVSDGIDDNPATGGRALWVGMVTTLRLAIAGILSATVLGIIVGLGRLSNNWVVNKVATVFVETLRNIPLLVQIFLYFTILSGLSRVALDTGPINGWLHVSNKGVAIPRIKIADGFYQWLVLMVIGAFIARFVFKNRVAEQERTGNDSFALPIAAAVLAAIGVIAWFIHPIIGFLEAPLRAISDVLDGIPQIAVQLGLVALFFLAAARFVKNFRDSRRTPAGMAALTDDDWFRQIFAFVAAAMASVFVLIIWPGLSDWIVNSSSDLFGVLADKFGTNPETGADRSGAPFAGERPDIVQRGNFPNYGDSGLQMSQAWAAIFFAVTFYTAAFIAEIIRGGILAVAKGQSEAAAALGLSRMQALRKVILPQAFRIVLPPIGNQYLNLTKNTSLAVAVGLADVVQVGGTINSQSGKALSVFVIWMAFYLACSLTISVIVNFFNVRMKIVER